MEMSNKEIASRFRRSGESKNQIAILAQLNACSKKKIVDILISEGYENLKKETTKKAGVCESAKKIRSDKLRALKEKLRQAKVVEKEFARKLERNEDRIENLKEHLAEAVQENYSLRSTIQKYTYVIVDLERQIDKL